MLSLVPIKQEYVRGITMQCRAILLVVWLPSVWLGAAELYADEPKADEPAKVKSRTFEFTYAGVVKDLKPGEEASFWLPVPQSSNEQQVKLISKKLPAADRLGQETQYGNKLIFFQAKANEQGEIPFELRYWIKRNEIRTDHNAKLTIKPRPEEPLKRFLEPDKM